MARRELRGIPRAVVAGVALVTVLRLAIGVVLPLGDDETFYWEWSRHLAPGYLDQPPAIAWLIHASTAVFGNTAFAVHLVAAALLGVPSLALWVLARQVLGRGDGGRRSVQRDPGLRGRRPARRAGRTARPRLGADALVDVARGPRDRRRR